MTSLTIVLLMLSLQAVMGSSLKDFENHIKKCTVPQKFEGNFKITFKSTESPIITGSGTVHADYTTERALTTEHFSVKGTTLRTRYYVSNHNTYIANPSKRECRKENYGVLPGTLPTGVPLTITRGVVHGVRVQIWEFSFSKGAGTASYYMSEDKCMFVKVAVKRQNSYFIQDFYEMKEGIKDPSVFDLPKYCVRLSYYPHFLSQVEAYV